MGREGTVGTRTFVALGVGASLLLSACSTDRQVTRPDPVPVTEERLTEALIDDGDLPDGYVVVDGPGSSISTEVLPEHACDDAIAELQPEEEASRDFTGPDTRVTHTVAWFPGQGAAVEQLFRDVAEDCNAVVAASDGLSIRTGQLDFGVLTQRTLPIRFELEPEVGVIEERDVVIRRAGDLVSVITLVGPRPSDKALLDGAVRVAIGYLGLLHDDVT